MRDEKLGTQIRGRSRTIAFIAGGSILILISTFSFLISRVSAFTGPSASPPSGSGAIGTDSAKNVSFGSSTTSASTKVYIVASSTSNADYSIRVVQPGGAPLFNVRNDGIIGVATTTTSGATTTLIVQGDAFFSGTVTATTFGGPISGTVNATNVSAGTFGANTGFGNYTFGTSTNPILHIDNVNARVGIGTTGPQALLHVASGNTNTADLVYLANSQGRHGVLGVLNNTDGDGIYLGGGNLTKDLAIKAGGNVGIRTTTPSSTLHILGGFQIATSTSSTAPSLFVSSSTGNVGIGTAGPAAQLHIFSPYATVSNRHISAAETGFIAETENSALQIIGQDSSEWMAHLILSGVPAIGNNKHWIMYHSGPSGSNNLKIGYKTSSATNFDPSLLSSETYLAITTTGNVGIGTTGPGQKLDITDATGGAAIRINSTGIGGIAWDIYSTSDANSVGGGKFAIVKSTDSTSAAKLLINSAGNVGIGTTGPNAKLDVGGAIRLTTTPGVAGSVELFTAVGTAATSTGTALCQSVTSLSSCVAHFGISGAPGLCSTSVANSRALCARLGD